APSHASTIPASSSRVIERPPTRKSSSAFPVGSSHVFTLPSPRVPGNPDFLRSTSCYSAPYSNANTFSAHLYTTGSVYTYVTQAFDSRHLPPSVQPIGERFIATISATMEKMSSNPRSTATAGCSSLIPPLKDIYYSDHQMVESKA
ncbi:hypothetical protein P5673_032319, partial [Acropora cervicornis]